MTNQVIMSADRLRVLKDGATRVDTDQPMLHCKFLTGSISLPQRQAYRDIVSDNVIDQTDSYTLGTVPSGSNVILGMLKWSTPGNAERLVNDGKWMSYAGEMIQLSWASYYGATAPYVFQDYVQMTSLATFWCEVVGTTCYLRDKLYIVAPRNNFSFPNGLTRTRPASTLEYRLYVGQFS